MLIKKTSEKFYLFKNHNPAKVNYIDKNSGVFLIWLKMRHTLASGNEMKAISLG